MKLKEKHAQLIKSKSKELGFFFCGISKADFLQEEAPLLEKWLADKRNGKMDYMSNHFDMRLDPRLLVDNAKSVVSLLLNYYPTDSQIDHNAPKLSKYAYGEDYHFVIKDKLKELFKLKYSFEGR